MKLFEDHAFLLFVSLVCVIAAYVIIVIAGKPVDERLMGIGFVALVGALAGRSDAKK